MKATFDVRRGQKHGAREHSSCLASNCHGWNATLSHLQLVAADVVDDEDVERHGEEYDADDADDLEGLGSETFVN